MRAAFIAFEGGEGAGKSTQSALLAGVLRERGHEVLATREPGDSPRIGPAVREILLDPTHAGLSPRAEALLYAADRAEHVDAVVRPALARGCVVLTDRYVDSSLAYQGAGRSLDVAVVQQVNRWATDGLLPDLTVLLDVDPQAGLLRAGTQPDRLEAEPLEFHRRVRQAFLDLAAADPRRYLVLDAGADRRLVHQAVVDGVDAVLADPEPAR